MTSAAREKTFFTERASVSDRAFSHWAGPPSGAQEVTQSVTPAGVLGRRPASCGDIERWRAGGVTVDYARLLMSRASSSGR